MKILQVFGTRPEAIKMAPVVSTFENDESFDNKVCITAQHRGMLDQVIDFFGIRVDYDLDIMQSAQSLPEVTARILTGLNPILEQDRPDLVLVHGDTNTTMSASLAAFYNKIAIGHVEAGLRTHDLYSPWPEEANRLIADGLAQLCFAPTVGAQANLIKENIDPSKVIVTGNTVVDALVMAREKIKSDPATIETFEKQFSFLDPSKKLLLVTGHRRESFGDGFKNICGALTELSARPDVEILYPVHLNPNVKGPVHEMLSRLENVHLIEPQNYPAFVYLMDRSYMILTDSGGVQEEAPSLGKPVLVMRDTTERPEAIEAGTVKLVGTDKRKIIHEATQLLDHLDQYQNMAQAHNPYGDGTAAPKILEVVRRAFI